MPSAAAAPCIYHIALAEDWAQAGRGGEYAVSTLGKTLEDVGFIHCSFRDQVELVGRLIYSDVSEPLVVLVLDPQRLGAEVRVENLDGGVHLFPHVYGPVPVGAVTSVLPVRTASGDDGRFVVGWDARTESQPPPATGH